MAKKNRPKECKKYWEFKNVINDKSADLYIYGDICSWVWEDETSATSFKADLDSLGDIQQLNLHINSCGGDVFEGITIGNMIKSCKAKVIGYADGLAASIASVILDSCDEVVMYTNSMQMIHNALCMSYGNAKDFRKMADDLDKITASLRQTYLDKAGDKLTEDKLIELMDNETWLSAQDCFDLGLCDRIEEGNKMVAKISKKFAKFYNHIPESIEVESVEPKKEPEDTAKVDKKLEEKEKENKKVLSENKKLQDEIEDLKKKLDESNEKVLSLNDKVSEMQPIIDEYNKKVEEEKKLENEKKLDDLTNEYQMKFTNLNALDKFKSEEVQELIKNSVENEENISKLNSILVNLISINKEDSKLPKGHIDKTSEISNLIDTNGAKKYGFEE